MTHALIAAPGNNRNGAANLSTLQPGKNLILVHGMLGTASTFGTGSDQDLIAGLSECYDNILLYIYPSGLFIDDNANWLYNQIMKTVPSSSYSIDIIAHSLGGLVVRYMVEQSLSDPRRTFVRNYDDATSSGPVQNLGHVITLGTPHLGVLPTNVLNAYPTIVGSLASALIPVISKQAVFLQQVPADSSFMQKLAASAFSSNCSYGLVAGQISTPWKTLTTLDPGTGSAWDGLVDVSSALALGQLGKPYGISTATFPPEGNSVSFYDHVDLHVQAIQNFVRDQIEYWLGYGYTISGQVTDSVTGDPVKGVSVSLAGTTTFGLAINPPAVTTDSTGSYSFLPKDPVTSNYSYSAFPPLVRGSYTLTASTTTPNTVITPSSVSFPTLNQNEIENFQTSIVETLYIKADVYGNGATGVDDHTKVDLGGYGTIIDWPSPNSASNATWIQVKPGSTLQFTVTYIGQCQTAQDYANSPPLGVLYVYQYSSAGIGPQVAAFLEQVQFGTNTYTYSVVAP
jgi:hypothetical protein